MRCLRWGSLALGAAIAWGPAPAYSAGEKATAEIKDRDGKSLGKVEIVGTSAGALLRIKLAGLPPGPHGFHVHETGTCEGDFSSAGGIYNPLGAQHGFMSEEGPMIGDLTNLIADAAGSVEIELLSPFLILSKEAEESAFDADGSALVIFEKPDDYEADPEGNAGARIACGPMVLGK